MKSASSPLPLSEDLLLLSPTFVFATRGAAQGDFTRVFHSSVWAFLLVALLLTIGLLAGFELLHPFGFRMHRFWNYEETAKLTFPETVLFVFGGLFLKTPSKRPLSLPGNILALFWSAFCLCIVALFLAGTAVLVFASPRASGQWLSALPRGAAPPPTCSAADRFCSLTRNMACASGEQSRTCSLLRAVRPSAESGEELWRRVTSGEVGLVTDSLAASQLLLRGANVSAVQLGPPIASLAFLVRNRSLLASVSSGVLQLREQHGVFGGAQALDRAGDALPEQLSAAVPIRLPMATAVFVLLMVGAVLALLAMASEFVMRTFVTKDHKKLDSDQQQNVLPSETRV